MIAQRCKGIWNLACLSWLSYSSCSQKAVRHFLTVWKLFFFSFLFPSLMFHQRGMNFNSLLCILSLTSMCESPLWHMPAVFFFFFFWKNSQQTTIIKQVTEGFSFPIFSPTTRLFFWAVPRRDLHKAELLIASSQGVHLDSASHPFFCG